MKLEDYLKQAPLTASPVFYPERVPQDVIHATFGMVTEAGEALDAVKKALFYGKQIDLANIDEEVGDLLWYIALYAKARAEMLTDENLAIVIKNFPGVKFKEEDTELITAEEFLATIMQTNIDKLRHRFPNRFTEYDAQNRDLAGERAILEGKAP